MIIRHSTMAPSAVQQETIVPVTATKSQSFPVPLKSSKSLDQYESIDITPVIGTEYPNVKLIDLINAPNADELLRDLAIKSKHPKSRIMRLCMHLGHMY